MIHHVIKQLLTADVVNTRLYMEAGAIWYVQSSQARYLSTGLHIIRPTRLHQRSVLCIL